MADETVEQGRGRPSAFSQKSDMEQDRGRPSAFSQKSNMEQGRGRPSAFSQKSRKSRASRLSIVPKAIDLDDVLVNELGQFGRFQLTNILLVAIPIIMSAFMSEYIFSAASIPHRCAVPQCDGTSPLYEPEWILNAIPPPDSGDARFSSCERYLPVNNSTPAPGTCPADLFSSNTEECDSWFHDRTNSVVYDFGLECNEWMRAFAGMMSSIGTLLVLPITGYVSDRFGRRVALVISITNLAVVGFIRAFSTNYPMYLALQLLQTTLGAGTFSSAYVFATEMVGPKYRVVTSATCSSMFAVGQVVLGSVAWLIQPWRYMIMALHIPCILVISYYWILSESVRWLLSKQKYEDAKEVLNTVARVNKKEISEKTMKALMNPPAPEKEVTGENKPSVIAAIFSSPVLLRRICTTPIWWITTTFVYYGLSINATSLSGNMYLNYIVVCAIEIPGFYTAVLVLDRIGRKATLTSGYFLSAACNIAFVFVGSDMATVRLVLFLVGKFGISVVFTSLYLYTSELYPTEYRHSLIAFSSMIGRIGSITAPLTPPLILSGCHHFVEAPKFIGHEEFYDNHKKADIWQGLPSLLFGCMGFLAGVLVLTQPETLGTKMPDTLAEAEAIGRGAEEQATGAE